jgi:hypothetical protein
MRMARLFFLYLFLGQNGLHHIAGLGDVREVDLRGNCLACARRRGPCVTGGMLSAAKMPANLVGLVFFERA